MTKSLQATIKGLYAITPDELDTSVLLNKVRAALRGGADVLQYRNKLADAALRISQAQELRILTREYGVTYIINDDASLALQVDADGVHLGGDDGGMAVARALLGADKLIGVSCYNRRALAQQAELDGADYIAFGAFFTSSVKPEAVVASVDMLHQARLGTQLPIVAIGGITVENCEQLLQAGADALAVISAVFSASDIEQTARQFSVLADR
jgi:thiamine-phosphate pyrophosphorylase